MIVSCLINRIEVYRGYKLKIDFNLDLGKSSPAWTAEQHEAHCAAREAFCILPE